MRVTLGVGGGNFGGAFVSYLTIIIISRRYRYRVRLIEDESFFCLNFQFLVISKTLIYESSIIISPSKDVKGGTGVINPSLSFLKKTF